MAAVFQPVLWMRLKAVMKTVKDRKGVRLRIAAAALATPMILFAGICVYIGVRYEISPALVGRMLVRHGVLLGVHAATMVYDPSDLKTAELGPAGNSYDRSDTGEFARIETFDFSIFKNGRLRVVEVYNPRIIHSRHHFAYQPYDEPKLHAVRQEYRLDEIVEGAATELEAMVLLRNWARSRFRRYDYQPLMDNFDALKVLQNDIRNPDRSAHRPGQIRPCKFFPLFYSQILLSMGYQVRMVRISDPESNVYDGHGMTEVWSNQFEKWITMDPDLNLHYERDGEPLNLIEVHNARYEPRPTGIEMVRGVQTAGDMDEIRQFTVEEMINQHTYIQIIDMRNDWMTNYYFQGHPMRSDQASLVWVDDNVPPVFHMNPTTRNVADFYWTLNQAEIWTARKTMDGESLAVVFSTVTPNFKHFEVTMDEGQVRVIDDGHFEWVLHEGRNSLRVRPVNQFGIKGVESRVVLFWE